MNCQVSDKSHSGVHAGECTHEATKALIIGGDNHYCDDCFDRVVNFLWGRNIFEINNRTKIRWKDLKTGKSHVGVEQMQCPHCHKNFKIEKTNWSDYFGKSLNKKVAELKAKGLTKDQIFNTLNISSNLNQEERKNLAIGVSSRYGEICSEMNEYIKVKRGMI